MPGDRVETSLQSGRTLALSSPVRRFSRHILMVEHFFGRSGNHRTCPAFTSRAWLSHAQPKPPPLGARQASRPPRVFFAQTGA